MKIIKDLLYSENFYIIIWLALLAFIAFLTITYGFR